MKETRAFWVQLSCIALTIGSLHGETEWSPLNAIGSNRIEYTGGLFVSVGFRGQILSSIDGREWIGRWNPTGQIYAELYGVASGDGMMVSVGTDGVVVSSTDLINWEPRESGTSADLFDVAYGNGCFVAVGARVILRSTDGIGWSPVPFEHQYPGGNEIEFGGGMFLIKYGGNSYRSSDGLSWDEQTALSSGADDLCYGKGLFVKATTGRIGRTTDGISWSDAEFGNFHVFRSVTYGHGRFVAAGDDGILFTSSDAITWTPRDSSLGINQDIHNIEFGNGVFTGMVSAAGTALRGFLFSKNGIDWEFTTNDLWIGGSSPSYNDIAAANGLYVAVGNNKIIRSSTDRRTWVTREFDDTPGNSDKFYALAYGAGRWVAVGNNSLIYSSADGLNWQQSDAPPGGYAYEDIAFGSGRFVAIGDYSGVAATSTNGIDWVSLSLHPSNERPRNIFEIAYGDGVFVVPSLSSDEVFRSEGGLSWTTSNSENAPHGGVAFGNGKFVAANFFSQKVSTSMDGGLTWSSTTIPNAPFLGKVFFGSGQFFVGEYSGGLLYSPLDDGSWSTVSTGLDFVANGFNGLATGHLGMVLVGGYLCIEPDSPKPVADELRLSQVNAGSPMGAISFKSVFGSRYRLLRGHDLEGMVPVDAGEIIGTGEVIETILPDAFESTRQFFTVETE